jgi:adenylyltransferase/sulfurtransferase
MALTPAEITHYQRHLTLPGFGLEAQEKLKASSVLVIGAGGLGCPVLMYLAAAGIGKIGIVDFDIISQSNLHRQVLYSTEDVGRSKATVAVEKLRAQNPHIQLVAYQEQLNAQNALSLLKEYDIVVDGSDNFSTRYLVNDACVISNKPLVSGSLFTFQGQVSVFNYQGGPTYRCLFPEPPPEEEMPNCAEIGVLGVLPGVIGTLMATEVIKMATGIGEVVSGKLLLYDALAMRFQTLEFEGKEENKQISQLGQYDFSCVTKHPNQEITSEEVKEWKRRGTPFQLIDVREPYEFEAFNIEGENMPLSELEDHVLHISKTRKVVIHCQVGSRSRKAIQHLESKYGFSNLLNLKNGLKDW